jgi:ectoine hydroxylase-related dioxygenase (phytanoyl-CoA dioxygenase family)
MSDIQRVTNAASLDDVVAIIESDGGVIVEDFLSADVLEEIKADLLPLLDRRGAGQDDFTGFKTRRMSALFAKTRRMADIVTHPLFLGAAEALINRPVAYWSGENRFEMRPGVRVSVAQLIQIAPGETAQMMHRDHWASLWRVPAYGRHVRLQVMIAISDFTAENGGTLVLPGSHVWDDETVPDPAQMQPTVMRAGSAILFLGSTYHAGGANRTADEYRTGLTVAIDSAAVRQEENMYLSLSPEVVKSYPDEIRKLLGWTRAEDTLMGWVEIDGELTDPARLLA